MDKITIIDRLEGLINELDSISALESTKARQAEIRAQAIGELTTRIGARINEMLTRIKQVEQGD
jgi:hypothetical protein